MPMRQIELRDTSNVTVYAGQIDVVGSFPDIVTLDGKSYTLKNVSRTVGVGAYREATVTSLDPKEMA